MIVSYLARQFDIDPVPYNTTVGAHVGGETALDSHDGDGSYLELTSGVYGSTAHTFRFVHDGSTPDPPAGVDPIGWSFEADWSGGGTNNLGAWNLGGMFPDGWGGRTVVNTSRANPSGYATETLVPAAGQAMLLPVATRADYWQLQANDPSDFGQSMTVRLTYLRMDLEYPSTEQLPLRQWPRDDGLTLGVARWQGGTSRQRSIRWAGYL